MGYPQDMFDIILGTPATKLKKINKIIVKKKIEYQHEM
jgi:hypothetical protein